MATDPRPARSQSAFSNSPAKLPSLPTVRVTDPQMQRFVDALRVWVDSRSGARDNFEKAVTVRDLVQLGLVDGALVARGILSTGVAAPSVVVQTPTGAVTMSNEAFARTIVDSRVFQEVIRRLDDPSRFDSLPDLIRERLQADIAAEASKRGADIRRIEEKLQEQGRSLAITVDEVTAAVNTSVAGVRESTFAYAEEGRAVAGKVTQIQARIDGVPIPLDQIDTTVYATLAALQAAVTDPLSGKFYQVDDPGSTDNLLYLWNGTAFVLSGRGTVASATSTIEEQAIATADRAKGLEAQYTLKVQAGGAIAGFGLAATQTADGNATSAMIIAADKFAIVDPSDTISDPLAPPASRVPFGVDTVNDIVYINGQVRINASGPAIEDLETVRMVLNRTTFLVSTAADGTGGVFGAQAEAAIQAFEGSVDETSTWTFSATATNCTAQMWNGTTWVSLPGNITGISNPRVRVTAMSADNCSVAITATKTGYTNLTATFSGSKVKAGTPGSDGATGDRGSLTGYGSKYSITTGSWVDGLANRVIYNMLFGTTGTTSLSDTWHLRLGDTVTLGNGTSFAATKYWGGTSWLAPGVVIDGNLLVSGTVSASAIFGTTLSAIRTNTGTLTVDSSGYIRGGQTDYATGTGFFLGYSGSAYKFSVGDSTNYLKWSGTALEIGGKGRFYGANASNYVELGLDANGSVVRITKAAASILPSFYIYDTYGDPVVQSAWISNASGHGMWINAGLTGLLVTSATGTTNTSPVSEVIGSHQEAQFRAQGKATSGLGNQHAARFYAFNASNTVVASGIAGEQAGRAFYGEVGTIAPFTGAHDALLPIGITPDVGDILVDMAVAAKRDVSNTLFETALSFVANQSAIGVFVQAQALTENNLPAAMLEIGYDEETNTPIRTPTPEFFVYKDTHAVASINALGEGQINVCGENGDIQAGDLIVTSSMAGKGMRQADDIVRSYTVAKARETVTFSSPAEVKQIACIYLCG